MTTQRIVMLIKWLDGREPIEITDLRRADLRRADLSGANLSGANLREDDLRGADLCRANLRWADLREADLREADLCGVKGISPLAAARLSICPEGDLIGWKKLEGGGLCKLLIPKEARRSNATGRKCRAEYATVLEGEGHSQYLSSFYYTLGQTIRPDSFDEDRWNECSNGIHFFLTKEEAEAY